MANIRRGPIPSDLGWLTDYLDGHEERLRTLEGPDGGQAAGVLSYLASLRTYGASGANLNSGTVPNDALDHWFNLNVSISLAIPTRKFLVTASLGEASASPGGNYVTSYVSYQIVDAYGNVIPGGGVATNLGRLYTATRLGVSISTGPQKHEIVDTTANPGPYLVQLFGGMWVATANTTPASTQFNDPSLIVQVIGEGAGA